MLWSGGKAADSSERASANWRDSKMDRRRVTGGRGCTRAPRLVIGIIVGRHAPESNLTQAKRSVAAHFAR